MHAGQPALRKSITKVLPETDRIREDSNSSPRRAASRSILLGRRRGRRDKGLALRAQPMEERADGLIGGGEHVVAISTPRRVDRLDVDMDRSALQLAPNVDISAFQKREDARVHDVHRGNDASFPPIFFSRYHSP